MESLQKPHPLINKNLLIIGGTGRNVGKTTLAMEIIKKTSLRWPVIGLKVSTHKKGEEEFHGNHVEPVVDTYRINIEKGLQPHKDTAAMLRAGAKEAYYIETSDQFVLTAWTEFKTLFDPLNTPVVCESRSLRRYVKPGLFILLVDPDNTKDNSMQYKDLADYIYYYNKNLAGIIELASRIEFTSDGWVINNKPPQLPDEVL